MKFRKLFILGAIIMLTGCSEENSSSKSSTSSSSSTSSEEYNGVIKFVEISNGKKLVIGQKFETEVGAFGVQTGDGGEEDYVSKVFSTNYSKVEKSGDSYICEATVSTKNGSTFKTVDTIYEEDDHVQIDRHFEVIEGDQRDKGFSIYFQIESVTKTNPFDFKWFAPSAYFGNDEYNFYTPRTNKCAYDGISSNIPNDNVGMPILMCYANNSSFSLMHTTNTLCETTLADLGNFSEEVQVDERFATGSMGIVNVDDNTQLFEAYPGSKSNQKSNIYGACYRLLPLTKGLSRDLSYSLRIDTNDDFFDAITSHYRYAFDYFKVVDKRYAAKDVYQRSLEYIDKSYGIIDKIPQYMCNSDHHSVDSGFLHRNVDLAYVMLSAGRKQGNQKWVDNALTVIESQLKHDYLDTGLTVSTSPFYTNRASVDALSSFALCYKSEVDKGYKHNDWKNYLINKAAAKMDVTNWLHGVFFSTMALVFNSKTYANKAIEIMNTVKAENMNLMATGTLSDTDLGAYECQKEGGILTLNAYMNLYEFTKDEEWLTLAKRCAQMVEMFQYVAPITMDVYDNVGIAERTSNGTKFENSFNGNGRFLNYGLNFIGMVGVCADNCGLFAAPDFYRLYLACGDKHYLDFYEYLTYNSVLYVNMGDKVGTLDDVLYSSGYGFQSEYMNAGVGGGYIRGTMHDSNLGWNMYAVLSNYEKVNTILGDDKIVPFDDENRDFDIKKNKHTDKVGDYYVTDFLELCHVSSIEGIEGNIEYSVDKETWETAKDNFDARYVRFSNKLNPKTVHIYGLPYTYKALNYENSTGNCSDSLFASAQDWDYGTTYIFKTAKEVTIRFSEEHTICETALKVTQFNPISFDILVSLDGTEFINYASFNDYASSIHVTEKIVEGVKAVRIKNNNSTSFTVSEFKVLGI